MTKGVPDIPEERQHLYHTQWVKWDIFIASLSSFDVPRLCVGGEMVHWSELWHR